MRLAAVAGISDPHQDEVLAALVVMRPSATVTTDCLRAFCREPAAIYKVPSVIEIVADKDMPLTDTGKVSKRLIQAHTQELGLWPWIASAKRPRNDINSCKQRAGRQ